MSVLSKLLPLLLLLFLLLVGGAIALVIYAISAEVASKTSEKMSAKNVSFSKDGLKVGVKGRPPGSQEYEYEGYVGRTQR